MLFSLVLIPHSTQMYRFFMQEKKNSATLNIKASEFGQKFGDWMIYMNKTDDKNFQNVVMFNTSKESENFIIAKEMHVKNENGNIQLELLKGKSFQNKELFQQINFEALHINDSIQNKPRPYLNTFEYWSKGENENYRKRRFAAYVLLSLFPLVSIFFALSFAVGNVRYQRSFLYVFIFLAVGTYYGVSFGFNRELLYLTIPTLLLPWLLLSTLVFYQKVLKKF